MADYSKMVLERIGKDKAYDVIAKLDKKVMQLLSENDETDEAAKELFDGIVRRYDGV